MARWASAGRPENALRVNRSQASGLVPYANAGTRVSEASTLREFASAGIASRDTKGHHWSATVTISFRFHHSGRLAGWQPASAQRCPRRTAFSTYLREDSI